MNFLEEAYEAVDAIDLDDPELLCEELGDVLMQVGFLPRSSRRQAALLGSRSVTASAVS